MTFREDIKKFRIENNKSQGEMADLLGISQQVYSNIERGINKKFDSAIKEKFEELKSEMPNTPYISMEANIKGLFTLVVEIKAEITAHTSALAEILAKQSGVEATEILSEFQRVYKTKLNSLQNELQQQHSIE